MFFIKPFLAPAVISFIILSFKVVLALFLDYQKSGLVVSDSPIFSKNSTFQNLKLALPDYDLTLSAFQSGTSVL